MLPTGCPPPQTFGSQPALQSAYGTPPPLLGVLKKNPAPSHFYYPTPSPSPHPPLSSNQSPSLSLSPGISPTPSPRLSPTPSGVLFEEGLQGGGAPKEGRVGSQFAPPRMEGLNGIPGTRWVLGLGKQLGCLRTHIIPVADSSHPFWGLFLGSFQSGVPPLQECCGALANKPRS